MAASKVLCTVGKALGGIFLSLTGSWLLVVCLGGLLTLGILSVFHLGVLLSLGCIGLCLLLVGVCVLCHLISTSSKEKAHWLEDNAATLEETSLPSESSRKKSDYSQPFHLSPRSEKNSQLEQKDVGTRQKSYNPFN
jgi:hypothetical protein